MEELYTTYARLYDIIYYKEEKYQDEVNFLLMHKPESCLNILDLCGGTGSHANLLVMMGHQVTIVDRSSAMLEIAKKKNPLVKVVNKDIFTFNSSEKFDLVLCMYGAIHYTESAYLISTLIKRLPQFLKSQGKVVFDLRCSPNLPENNQLDFNNGYWNRKFFRIGKGIKNSDLYVVTAFNREEHFLDVHNLYYCDPFLFVKMFKDAGFCNVHLNDGYTPKVEYNRNSKNDIAVLVASN